MGFTSRGKVLTVFVSQSPEVLVLKYTNMRISTYMGVSEN